MALTGITGAITSLSSTGEALTENHNRCFTIGNLMCYCGNAIETYFGFEDSEYERYAAFAWKKMLEFDTMHKNAHGRHLFNDESLIKFTDKVKRIYPDYVGPLTNIKVKAVPTQDTLTENPKTSSSTAALILGVLGIIAAWIFALAGHALSIIGIIIGAKHIKETGNSTGLILSIIGEACACISSLIGIIYML